MVTVLGHMYVAGHAAVDYGIKKNGVSIFSIALTGAVDVMVNLDPSGDGVFGAHPAANMTPDRRRRTCSGAVAVSCPWLLTGGSSAMLANSAHCHSLGSEAADRQLAAWGAGDRCVQQLGFKAQSVPSQAPASRTLSSYSRPRCPHRSGCWASSTSTCRDSHTTTNSPSAFSTQRPPVLSSRSGTPQQLPCCAQLLAAALAYLLVMPQAGFTLATDHCFGAFPRTWLALG